MLLDALYGAEVRYLLDDDDNDSLAAAMDAWVAELRRDGRRPYALPIGGSTGLGALGYVRAMRELAAQVGPGPFQVVTAVGSCGTFAGLNLGARLFAPGARVVGISVSRTARQIVDRTAELVAESAALLGIAPPPLGALRVSRRVPRALRRRDGVGRGGDPRLGAARGTPPRSRLHGQGDGRALRAGPRRAAFDPDVPVVFLHTGGLPILFAVDLPEEHA